MVTFESSSDGKSQILEASRAQLTERDYNLVIRRKTERTSQTRLRSGLLVPRTTFSVLVDLGDPLLQLRKDLLAD